jgi:hypothetical protein
MGNLLFSFLIMTGYLILGFTLTSLDTVDELDVNLQGVIHLTREMFDKITAFDSGYYDETISHTSQF